MQNFSFMKMHLKISSTKRWPFCPRRDELMEFDSDLCGYKYPSSLTNPQVPPDGELLCPKDEGPASGTDLHNISGKEATQKKYRFCIYIYVVITKEHASPLTGTILTAAYTAYTYLLRNVWVDDEIRNDRPNLEKARSTSRASSSLFFFYLSSSGLFAITSRMHVCI